MQFSHIGAEIGNDKKMFGRLLAQLNLEWDEWRQRKKAGQEDWLGQSYAASSSLSRGRQETEAEKNA